MWVLALPLTRKYMLLKYAYKETITIKLKENDTTGVCKERK